MATHDANGSSEPASTFQPEPDLAGLGEGAVLPRYGGVSIANLPATVGGLLGVGDGWAAPPLEVASRQALGEADRVILLVVDGLGWNRLQAWDGAGRLLAPQGGALLRTAITSVTPATTTAATTVILGNGAGPAESGIVGFSFLLPEQGVLANMLRWVPAALAEAPAGELERWGLVPEAFVPSPSLAQVLAASGVSMHAYLPAGLTRTPLSRMQMRGATVNGYLNWADLWSQLSGWRRSVSGRGLAYAYLPDIDTVGHRDGPAAPLWDDLLARLSNDLEDFISSGQGEGGRTVVLLTADHGHVATPLSERREFQEHPRIRDLTSIPPGGEARHVNLYARGGCKPELLGYCREYLSADFHVLDATEALSAGLYGPLDRAHPEVAARLGDVLLLSKGSRYLWDSEVDAVLLGMHGSLEPDEMLVPFLALGT